MATARPGPDATVVTGAGGFVGRHLMRSLTDASAGPLIEWHRTPPATTEGGHIVRHVDVLDRDAVQRAIAQDRPARLVHLAGAPHVGDAWRHALHTLQVNVMGTHHVLEAVRRACPSCRVLVVTSGMIYRAGDSALTEDAPLVPTNPYGVSKLAQDQLAHLAAAHDDLDVVIARPFNHIGPGQDPSFAISSFARQIALIESGRTAPVIHVGNLDARRDLTDVRDVVSAYTRILNHAPSGIAFNVCSGRAYRIGDLLDDLCGRASVPITITEDPARLRPSDVPLLLGSHERLREALGWQPAIPIDVTLSDTLEWWRSAVAAGRVTA